VEGSTRPLSILVIDNDVYPLKYGYMQELFGRSLANRGHKIVWLLRARGVGWGDEAKDAYSNKVVLTPLRDTQAKWSKLVDYFYYKPRLTRALPGLLEREQIDLIFVRNQVRVGFSTCNFCKRRQIPFVFYLGYPTLESHRIAARLGYRRPRIIAELAATTGIPLRNWITRKADFVFAMSSYWVEQLVEELGIPSDRIQALPAGFDSSLEPDIVGGRRIRQKLNLGDCPTFFYMGAITPPRDVTILVDILAGVVRYLPEARLLLLYGQGEEKALPRLEKKFYDKGIQNNVIFEPPVSYQEVPEYIAASHVGISPIETIPHYNVSSPYKFTEMLGMGCPVVASNTADQKSVLNKSRGGLCVRYNAEAFVEAIVYLLTHPEEARLMGQRGRAFVETERSFDVLAGQVEEVFRRVVQKAGTFKL